ncbi:hypothetical protein LIER_34571 [Lithospermum erythrorhizon]|uniref:Uncharacterized protein n=1 Tax=Lithospermum erythrorhizon TaxID=34254 RepID=A0AAV3S1P8_LITER
MNSIGFTEQNLPMVLLSGKYSIPRIEDASNIADSTVTVKQEGVRPHMFKSVIAASHPEFSSMRQQPGIEASANFDGSIVVHDTVTVSFFY